MTPRARGYAGRYYCRAGHTPFASVRSSGGRNVPANPLPLPSAWRVSPGHRRSGTDPAGAADHNRARDARPTRPAVRERPADPRPRPGDRHWPQRLERRRRRDCHLARLADDHQRRRTAAGASRGLDGDAERVALSVAFRRLHGDRGGRGCLSHLRRLLPVEAYASVATCPPIRATATPVAPPASETTTENRCARAAASPPVRRNVDT